MMCFTTDPVVAIVTVMFCLFVIDRSRDVIIIAVVLVAVVGHHPLFTSHKSTIN